MDALQPVRGTADLMPEAKAGHNQVIGTASQIASHYGFHDMATPIFEFTEVFSRPLGESSDVVSKETYSFEDRGGTSLTLRPENTAAVMRAILSNGLTQTLPQKLFYAGPMFRYERPQKGRMRQFHQIGVEFIGSASPVADAEVIACGAQILEALGVLSKTRLHLNSLGDTQSRSDYREALVAYFNRYSADLSPDSQRRLTSNPLRILDSKDEGDRKLLAEAPRLGDYLNDISKSHFDQLTNLLDKAGISWHHDPLLVRGLDYYCHSAFEFITDALGAQGTVMGGGRYDGLAEMLGGPHLPAVGFAAGVERLALLLGQQSLPAPDLALIIADDDARDIGFALAQACRHKGLNVDMPLTGNMGKKLKRASKMGARFAAIIGSDEMAAGQVTLRHLSDGTQDSLAQADLATHLTGLCRP